MPRHVVAQGEFLAEIARRLGFVDWKSIFEHPANATLWERGRKPDLLLPGDVLEIPAKREKRMPRKTGATHEFKLRTVQNRLRLVLKDADGKALANEPFTLRMQASHDMREDQGLEITESTTGSGGIDVPLPPGVVEAQLVLDEKPWFAWALMVGHLDPLHDPVDKKDLTTGVQGRLENLGFRCGGVDGVLGPKTRAAIARFQRKVMKRTAAEADGELDPGTREAIEAEHGC